MRPAKSWVSGWRTVAHVILVLSLVINVGININLDQPMEGTYMAKTINQSARSQKHNARRKNTNVAKVAATTNCMGARARRSA